MDIFIVFPPFLRLHARLRATHFISLRFPPDTPGRKRKPKGESNPIRAQKKRKTRIRNPTTYRLRDSLRVRFSAHGRDRDASVRDLGDRGHYYCVCVCVVVRVECSSVRNVRRNFLLLIKDPKGWSRNLQSFKASSSSSSSSVLVFFCFFFGIWGGGRFFFFTFCRGKNVCVEKNTRKREDVKKKKKKKKKTRGDSFPRRTTTTTTTKKMTTTKSVFASFLRRRRRSRLFVFDANEVVVSLCRRCKNETSLAVRDGFWGDFNLRNHV